MHQLLIWKLTPTIEEDEKEDKGGSLGYHGGVSVAAKSSSADDSDTGS